MSEFIIKSMDENAKDGMVPVKIAKNIAMRAAHYASQSDMNNRRLEYASIVASGFVEPTNAGAKGVAHEALRIVDAIITQITKEQPDVES